MSTRWKRGCFTIYFCLFHTPPPYFFLSFFFSLSLFCPQVRRGVGGHFVVGKTARERAFSGAQLPCIGGFLRAVGDALAARRRINSAPTHHPPAWPPGPCCSRPRLYPHRQPHSRAYPVFAHIKEEEEKAFVEGNNRTKAEEALCWATYSDVLHFSFCFLRHLWSDEGYGLTKYRSNRASLAKSPARCPQS